MGRSFEMKAYTVLSIFALMVLFSVGEATKLSCTKPNEEYQCGSACQTLCTNLGQPCPIVNIRCNDDCYCKEGYARDSTGRCIKISKCPK